MLQSLERKKPGGFKERNVFDRPKLFIAKLVKYYFRKRKSFSIIQTIVENNIEILFFTECFHKMYLNFSDSQICESVK